MTPRILGHLRTIATLSVLTLLVLYAVNRGLDEVSKPFPKSEDPPICVDEAVTAGDIVRPGGITLSVINAGTEAGRARATLNELAQKGFAEGQVDNLRDPEIKGAQIWVPGGKSAVARLVRSYLGGKVEVVDRTSTTAGITVVIGDDFAGVRKGRNQVKVSADETVCGPPALS